MATGQSGPGGRAYKPVKPPKKQTSTGKVVDYGKATGSKAWQEANTRAQGAGAFSSAYKALTGANISPSGAYAAVDRGLLGGGGGGGGGGRGGGGGGGGGGRGYGGGGGGGGGAAVNPAQTQMDFLVKLLGNQQLWKAPTQDALRGQISSATQQDKAAADAAYGALDQWLAQNQRNPYADVQLQNARFAPAQNAYLQSQGLSPMNDVQANPEDVGAQGAFRNVLALLGAGQQSSQQSRLAESQMGRTFAGQQIGAMDNAMLAAVAQREADAQTQLDNQRREALMQLAGIVGQGAAMPDLAALGLAPAAAAAPAADPLGWGAIAAQQAAAGNPAFAQYGAPAAAPVDQATINRLNRR